MRRWTSITMMAFLLLAETETRLFAQSKVTIRAVNQVPEKNIRKLLEAGVDLTEQDILELVESPLAGDTISVQAIVLSSPRNSGLSEVVAGRVARVHFFVRDLSAAEFGNSGMAIQVIDRNWDRHRVLDLSVGDVIDLTAIVSEFQNGIFLDPLAIELAEDSELLDLGPGILAADSLINVGDLNRPLGGGAFQARWQMLRRINGSPICLKGVMVEQVQTPSPPNRVDWALTGNRSSRIYTYDLSHRFRNDTRLTYPSEFNLRDDDFEPPAPGSIVSVCGFVVLQAFNDPDAVGRPATSSTGSMFSLIPMADPDLLIAEVPPSIDQVSRPERVLRSTIGFLVSSDINADTSRVIDSATLSYVVGSDTTQAPMVRQTQSTWTSKIPPTFRDGEFVRYWVKARDSAGLEVSSREYQYRVLNRGIDSISDVQETYDSGPGSSPFAESILPVDIVATLQSNPDWSGLFAIQDDSLLSPWSGVLLEPVEGQRLGLQRGDRVHITRARINEIDGVTSLSDLSIDHIARGDSVMGYAPVLTSELVEPDVAESYEGMLVQLNEAVAVEGLGTGEWSITNSHLADGVRVTNRYSDVADDAFMNWELRPYTRGLWLEAGSSWMLALESSEDVGEVVNVGVIDDGPDDSQQTRFTANYPNPFGWRTTLTFFLIDSGPARVEIFDTSGRLVQMLVDANLERGQNEIVFEANGLAAGTYLVRLTTATGSDLVVVTRLDQ